MHTHFDTGSAFSRTCSDISGAGCRSVWQPLTLSASSYLGVPGCGCCSPRNMVWSSVSTPKSLPVSRLPYIPASPFGWHHCHSRAAIGLHSNGKWSERTDLECLAGGSPSPEDLYAGALAWNKARMEARSGGLDKIFADLRWQIRTRRCFFMHIKVTIITTTKV